MKHNASVYRSTLEVRSIRQVPQGALSGNIEITPQGKVSAGRMRPVRALLASLLFAACIVLVSPGVSEAASSRCNYRNNCPVFQAPTSGGATKTILGSVPVTMICWKDGPWKTLNYSTNRWFWVSIPTFGKWWLHASEVTSQTSVPHC